MKAINFDLVIVGVGGQGTLLASKILGRLALDAGLGVKVSEVHGMSQRGGSVITHVRVGDSVHSPLVSTGNADYLLSFEALEGARAAGYLKPEGILIVNTQRISPMSVITGATKYPENPLNVPELKEKKVEALDALQLAENAGSQKAVNLVLLGKLSCHLPFSDEAWQQAIAVSVPHKTLEVNVRAFESGRTSAVAAMNV